MRIALGIEYNGFNFKGWQIQPQQRTVQGDLEQALSLVANETITAMQVAGRTDAGVHATEQIVHFDTNVSRKERAWVFGANRFLTHKDISVLWAKPVADDFHARFSALRRRYRYVIFSRHIRPTILSQYVSWDRRELSLEAMQKACLYLIGEHDFDAYRTVACQAHSPIKHVYSLEISQKNNVYYLDIEANAFLHHMVRNIAGVLLSIGAGEKEPLWAKQVLDSRDRTQGDVTAPPYGLYLTKVVYDPKFSLPDTGLNLPVFS
ncbi:MAG: tRNA pseudouridine(38-40) synthase TruA [Pseudomonadota bacterium]